MITNEERQLGRAKNAVLTFLENRLIVPKIYLDADWDGHQVDVLAIERDGVGDVHAVLLLPRKNLSDGSLDLAHEWSTEKKLLDRFSNIPAQFRYLGIVNTETTRRNGSLESARAWRHRQVGGTASGGIPCSRDSPRPAKT